MDKNGKILGKISIVDLAVLLLVVVVAIGTFYRFNSPMTDVDRGDHLIDFTIRIEGVRDFTEANYHDGLRVYDRLTGQFIGHIQNTRTEPNYRLITLVDGTIIHAPTPGQITILMDVVAHGRLSPTAIYVEGTYEITAGSRIYLTTKYVQVQGYIESVSIR